MMPRGVAELEGGGRALNVPTARSVHLLLRVAMPKVERHVPMRAGSKDEGRAAVLLGGHGLEREPGRHEGIRIQRRHGKVAVPVSWSVQRPLHKQRVLVEPKPLGTEESSSSASKLLGRCKGADGLAAPPHVERLHEWNGAFRQPIDEALQRGQTEALYTSQLLLTKEHPDFLAVRIEFPRFVHGVDCTAKLAHARSGKQPVLCEVPVTLEGEQLMWFETHADVDSTAPPFSL